ncbi:MAG: tripartite tricarboxylate transporter TctB family protein [Proteobacteria bacterium]|nr:tripartite tricarboxylate transporter TctB family protein [Pseudomonadota bacterium]
MTRLMAERLVAIGIILAAGFMYTQTIGWPQRAGAFPQFAEIGIMVLAFGMLARSLTARDKERLKGMVKFDFSYTAWKPVYVMLLGVIYSIAVFKIGFYVTSFFFYFIAAYMTGLRDHKLIVVTAAILFPLLYAFFTLVLGAFLPEGILF